MQLSREGLIEEPVDYVRSSDEDGSEIASDEDGLIRKARCVHVLQCALCINNLVSVAQVKETC